MNAKNSAANPCPICQSSTRELIDSEIKVHGPVTYKVCETCALIYKNTHHHIDPSKEKVHYDHHQNTMDNLGYVKMFERFIAEAIDPFIKNGKGLEFGSGPGPVLYELLKHKGFAMDYYDPYYHPNQTVFNETYDVITSTEVFEHLSDPVYELTRLSACLKPKGILAIMTSFHPDNDETFLSWWYRRDPTHIAFYRVKTFETLIADLPLEIIHTNDKNIIVFKKQ